jgi:enterochelin esterase-like enzyme
LARLAGIEPTTLGSQRHEQSQGNKGAPTLSPGIPQGNDMNTILRIFMAPLLGLALHAGATTPEDVEFTRQDQKPVSAQVYAAAPCRGIAIISPGAGGSERGYAYLGEGLARQGYLALVVGHAESGRGALREHVRGKGLREGLAELITEPQAYRGRFMDIAAARQWARSRCDAEDAVLIGHSMGAATALMEAGARNKLGVQGGDAFRAYIALSPQGEGSIFPENAWSGIRRPVLLITGTRDRELGGGSWKTRTEAFNSLPAGCKWLGVIDGATHMNFAGLGASRKTEALTVQAIDAFLDGLRRGDCRAPRLPQGIELSAPSGHSMETSPPVAQPRIEWVTRAVAAPRVSFHTFFSAAANAEVSYHLYAPAAYGREPERRWPVVYWLHGSGGGLGGIRTVAQHFDEAIESGKAPPCLVVMVNGLEMGMYVDWSNGQAPLESLIVQDLVPHIDAAYRTVAKREGRLLDGFSMGGYGAARLGFKYPELFRAVSIMGAGPMQESLHTTPRASRVQAHELLARVYGGSQDTFLAASPRTIARMNAQTLMQSSLIRVVIGDRDETYANNAAFHAHLTSLKIPHEWTVLPSVGHDPVAVMKALGDANWAFYRAAFGSPAAAQLDPQRK